MKPMKDTPFHMDAATGRYFFEKIPESDVDKKMVARAEDVRTFVCSDLSIEPPEIVWIRPAPTTSKRGPPKKDYEEELDPVVRLRDDVPGGVTPSNYSRNEIWIRSNLTACPNLEYVVGHEVRHAAQKKHCREVFSDKIRAEGDAYPYGYEVLKRYFASAGRLTNELGQEIDKQRAETQKWFRVQYPDGEYKTVECLAPGQHL